MTISFISCKCPECGAPINAEIGRSSIFCSYCGAKVLLNNENEYVVRTIDEAQIEKAKSKRDIRMRELDLEEQSQSHEMQMSTVLLYLWIASIVIIAAVCLVVGFSGGLGPIAAFYIALLIGAPVIGGGAYLLFKVLPEKKANERNAAAGGIAFPKSRTVLRGQNYQVWNSTLRSAGFTNVTCVNLHDVKLGLFQKDGVIEKVTVNGKETLFGGNVYHPDVPIIISYHGR